MSKSQTFQKTTSNTNQTINVDPNNISINGTSLTSTLTSLAAANSYEDSAISSLSSALADYAVLDSNNTFTGSNSFNVLTIPNVGTFNSAATVSNPSTLNGAINFTSPVKIVSDATLGKSDKSNNITINGSISVNGQTTYDTIPTTSTDLTANITSNNQLTNKKYVDNSITNLKAANSTFSGNNLFTGFNSYSGQSAFNNNVQLGKSDGTSTVSEYGIMNIHGPTTFDAIPSTATDQTSTITSNNQFTNKKYVDTSITNLLAANNTFTGNNTHSGSTSLTGDVQVGKMDGTSTVNEYGNFYVHGSTTYDSIPSTSTDVTSTITSNNQLTNKKYVDTVMTNHLAATNTFTGQNVFNNDVVLGNTSGLNNISQYGNLLLHGTTIMDNMPSTATDVTASITSNNQLTNKKYVDNSITNLKAATNTFSGANTFSNTLTVSGCMTASNGSLSLAEVPTLQGNYSQPTGNCLTTKAYVDSLVPYVPTPDTVVFGQQVVQYQSGANYVLQAPNLGSATASNNTGTYYDFYINFPSTSGSYTLFQNNATFDFNYWWYQSSSMTGYASASANTVTYNSARTNSNIGNTVGIFGLKIVNATFNVTIRAGAVLVYAPVQTAQIWTNPSTSSSTQGPVLFSNNYNTNSITMTYNPIQFTYINDSKIKVTVGYPCQENSPSKSYWISNLGFNAALKGSMPCNSTTFGSAVYAVPNATVNSLNGGAWLSST